MSAAITDDGDNTTEWQVAGGGGVLRWTAGETTAESETASSLQVLDGVSGVFSRPTTWTVKGSRLVFDSAAGSLTYSSTMPSVRQDPTGVAVFLDLNPHGGAVAPGQFLHLIAGRVTVLNAHGKPVLRVPVSEDDSGESRLPAGRYTVTAKISPGSCADKPAVIVSGQVSEVDLVCTSKATD